MHAISSASPSHVHIDGFCYAIVVWTVDPDDGCPIPWIVRDGVLTSFNELPFHRDIVMVAGSAPCIPVMDA